MDPIAPVGNGQGAGHEVAEDQVGANMNEPQGGTAIVICLQTPEILEKIFQYFSKPECLKLSLVNKVWKVEARRAWTDDTWLKIERLSIERGFRRWEGFPMAISNVWVRDRFVWTDVKLLRRDGSVFHDRTESVAVMSEYNTCEELLDFLQSFSRREIRSWLDLIAIKLGSVHNRSPPLPPANELDQFRLRHFPQINLRNLTITFGPAWYELQEYPLFLLLNQLLRAVVWKLEDLRLRIRSKRKLFLHKVLQDYKFPKLRVLRFEDVGSRITSAAFTNFIRELVSRAPNLETLYTSGFVNLRAILVKGSRVVAHITTCPYSPSLGEIPEEAAGSLQMTRLPLIGISEDVCAKRLDRILFQLLKGSRLMLNWMEIDLPFLLPLMYHEINLPGVTKFKINLDTDWFCETANQDAWNLIKSFDFNRIFPNLSEVTIEADWESHLRQKRVRDALSWIVGQIKGSAAPDRAVNIKHLNVIWDAELGERSGEALAQMFPDLGKLSIQANGMIPFDAIRSSWPDFKELDVTLIGAEEEPTLNLDSVFCGIFPEEVAELRTKDDDYLRAVNIVPVKPSITSLRRLSKFTLYPKVNFHSGPFDDERPDFLFSKVTPLIGFKNLDVTIMTFDVDIIKALRHLVRYGIQIGPQGGIIIGNICGDVTITGDIVNIVQSREGCGEF